ncbi:MAG: cob(I)yrinic acid a,c-diamide adenosyltransferase [Candidatus Electryonea clarkiae]|nr:cob(I)yrinic acid a,c-diamide adenosyltransferase [Candidatus Electryonea clarkiae]MDP8288810.1 cob(I)yrinic acid a,c-diamide adenosyltransferase [Candidatus Electryonea clarkiae]
MKIYTRTGDKGKTSLLKGGRVPKHHLRVEAYGTVDELNSYLGYIRAINNDPEIEKAIGRIQPVLHVLSSDVAATWEEDEDKPSIPRINAHETDVLEREIDRLDEELPELKHFILPGGLVSGASIHIARTISRRAERRMTELEEKAGGVNPDAIKFVNRLSDYLFTLARWANFRDGFEETKWDKG